MLAEYYDIDIDCYKIEILGSLDNKEQSSPGHCLCELCTHVSRLGPGLDALMCACLKPSYGRALSPGVRVLYAPVCADPRVPMCVCPESPGMRVP